MKTMDEEKVEQRSLTFNPREKYASLIGYDEFIKALKTDPSFKLPSIPIPSRDSKHDEWSVKNIYSRYNLSMLEIDCTLGYEDKPEIKSVSFSLTDLAHRIGTNFDSIEKFITGFIGERRLLVKEYITLFYDSKRDFREIRK